ncbi:MULTISPECIES: SDR family oxidoreductase [unclassified Achromobacter]|uniref:SDR family oxidoreductase n=1 Tax=unclassified Achromobacter TaxID=2626865 RepID=UPI000B51B8A5|nr:MULTISPECIES: SDR family oxidoreductase [unclassified Achromobacter]OWT70294.1 short-chain dehydrogenase [Achromobacter sp. HZ34]OWT71834.1 short-chain dehydrogenase [Achromobacter sp. HZ28]
MKTQAYLVTGASAGIGAAIARALLDAGRQVVNIDYRLPENPPAGLVSFQADLTDQARTEAVARQVTETYDIVGLVNNAGATRPGTADTASMADLDYVVNLHLRTALILTQAVLPAMRAAGFGRIVNMASRAALGKPERVVYSATKAGLIGMTRTLAMELGGDGITVNAIGPGPIATDLFTKSNPAGAPQTERIINSIVVKRLGTPEDVARAAMFFLAPENGFVTGQILYVCGGTTLGVAPV